MEKMPNPSWKEISSGVWKTDLGIHLPEAVILILPNDEFKKHFANETSAKEYIDSHHFLKLKLIKVVIADIIPAKGTGEWIVVMTHTPHSTVAIIALQTA